MSKHGKSIYSGMPTKCLQCDRTFTVSSTFKYHMMKHSGEKPYVCSLCGRAFIQSGTLNKHLKSHILWRSSNKPYRCKQCYIPLNTLNHLKRHNCSANKPHKCKQCDKSYNEVRYLKRHKCKKYILI